MSSTKLPSRVRTLLAQIAAGDPHRATSATYQYLLDHGLAERPDWSPWTLTDKGRSALA